MPSLSDIAGKTALLPISAIAEKAGILPDDIIPYGKYKAKVPLHYIQQDKISQSNLILVTAITPTKAGIGKTVTCVALSLGLNHIGKQAIVVLREPSLGPCFGMKGGAAGGGMAQVLPMEEINLHFTGDFHAITSANNMIAAMLDNYHHFHQHSDDTLKEISWRRVLDVNDRSLRQIVSGLGGHANGPLSETGFDITPASEIMALLCLAEDLEDLERRIEKIVLGYLYDKTPFTVKDLGVAGAITALLKEAILPNLVQTTEHTPAIIHGGPFANIAHGCNSVIATKTALSLADYVVTEAGFGSDLGAEKFFNIKCRQSGLQPAATLVVTTSQALKLHGGVDEREVSLPNLKALQTGMANLERHIDNLQAFGQKVMVVFNQYRFDSEDEINYLRNWCGEKGVAFAVDNGYEEGGEGAADMARTLVKLLENGRSSTLKFTYDLSDSITEKVEKVAKKIYRAGTVTFSPEAQREAALFEKNGWGKYPVCIAKTQYSFSDDPHLHNAPEGFDFHIRDLVINNGAGFVVAIAGDIMRMPGLPKEPNALNIRMVNGEIEGLK